MGAVTRCFVSLEKKIHVVFIEFFAYVDDSKSRLGALEAEGRGVRVAEADGVVPL